MAVIPTIHVWVKKCNNAISPVLSAPGPGHCSGPTSTSDPRANTVPLGGSEKNILVPPGPAMVTDPSQLQAAPGCPRCEAGGCVGTRWSPKCPTLESVAYMASAEEGVDHQEAHFWPALLLRGIPADLDPASEGRAVGIPKFKCTGRARACAIFLLGLKLK